MSMEKRMRALASMSKIFNEILVDHAGKAKKVAEEATEPEETEPEEEKKETKPGVKLPTWAEKNTSFAKPKDDK